MENAIIYEESRPQAVSGLYSTRSILLGTFLGSPLAASILMALNYRRIDKPAAARKALISGAISAAALIVLGFLIKDHAGIRFALNIAQLVLVYYLAKSFQGTAISGHKEAGGKMASAWGAAGIGILSYVRLYVGLFAALFTLGVVAGAAGF